MIAWVKRLVQTRSWTVALAVLVVWTLFSELLAPAAIRDAYRGESIELLNRAISGQQTHSVDYYLAAWRSLARPLTVALAALALLLWLWNRHAERARSLVARALGGRQGFDSAGLLCFAASAGALAGLAEAAYLGVYQVVDRAPANQFYIEVLWMAPLAAAISFLLLAAPLAALARAGRVKVGVGKATFIFGSLALYGVIQARGIPLYPIAGVMLAVGLAAALARLAKRGGERLVARVPAWSRWVAGMLVILTAVGLFQLPAVAERRTLRGLPEARIGLPNVLLIILDTVRAANLGLYGYHRATTPRLDAWARSGVVFERAYATAPWTLPSHATMFTGRYNYELGTGQKRPLGRDVPTLAEVLAEHGYATAGFTGNHLYTTDMSGLHRGFARFEDFPIGFGMFVSSSWPSRWLGRWIGRLTGLPFGLQLKEAEGVTTQFLDWLRHRKDRPFFAFLNYFDAHVPYWPPEPFRTRFGPPGRPLAWPRENTPEALQPWVNAYDGSIAYVDRELGVIFDTLASRRLLDRTLVIVTSDHGEMFGEHGQRDHRGSLYVPELHVPLVISLPGKVPVDTRITEAVTLRDLPATVLELAGLDDRTAMPGHSLARHWTAATEAGPQSPILAEVDHYRWAAAWRRVSRGDMKSLFKGRFHYILNGDGVEELYDLRRDPAEEDDLYTDSPSPPILAHFRAALDSLVR